MLRVPALCLVGCVGCAGLILSNDSPSFEARLPPAKTEPAALEIRKLAEPLFGPIQPRPEVPSSADDANSPLRDVRLTGVVIGPDLRIAIFAVSGADSLVLSEGDPSGGQSVRQTSSLDKSGELLPSADEVATAKAALANRCAVIAARLMKG
jgi:hypothetical protein